MATIKDVAKRAQVSPSTVSRVLNEKVFVDEETKRRVQEAIKALRYQPNPLARALRERRTHTIALIVPGLEDPLWPRLAQGVETIARKKGYVVVLCNSDEDVDREKQYLERLQRQWVEGIIIAPVLDDSPHVQSLSEQGFPVVQVVRGQADDGMDRVLVNHAAAAYDAVSYFAKTGHRHIALASGRQDLYQHRQCLEGYQKGLAEHGLKPDERLIFQEIPELQNLRRLILQQLGGKVPIDALLAGGSRQAAIALSALREAGQTVPGDVSVISIDSVEENAYLEPQLTAMVQPVSEMGQLAAQKLLYRISEPDAGESVTDLLTAKLILRQSTR